MYKMDLETVLCEIRDEIFRLDKTLKEINGSIRLNECSVELKDVANALKALANKKSNHEPNIEMPKTKIDYSKKVRTMDEMAKDYLKSSMLKISKK